MSTIKAATAEAIVDLIAGYRLPVTNEVAFQETLDQLLDTHSIIHLREYTLSGGAGRIDFYLPESKIGIELKVKGSPSKVTRQLYRYMQCSEITALILATGRMRLGVLPSVLNGKPLHVATLWESLF